MSVIAYLISFVEHTLDNNISELVETAPEPECRRGMLKMQGLLPFAQPCNAAHLAFSSRADACAIATEKQAICFPRSKCFAAGEQSCVRWQFSTVLSHQNTRWMFRLLMNITYLVEDMKLDIHQ